MADPPTSWTLIASAAKGDRDSLDQFARRYLPVVERYLRARWRGTAREADVDDSVQELLIRCLAPEGPLQRALSDRSRDFRGFLYGLARNVAREHERRRLPDDRGDSLVGMVEADDASLSRVFDREYALQVVREARDRLDLWARAAGPGAEQRTKLLWLRIDEGLPIREIAALWGADAGRLHHEYARARKDYHELLLAVLTEHAPGATAVEIEERARALLALLQG